jgi:Ni,Fe-hydrogenase III component G
METLANELERLFKSKRIKNTGKVIYLNIDAGSFMEITDFLKNKGVSLISLFAMVGFEKPGFSLMYIFESRADNRLLALNLNLIDKQAVSIARLFPAACYFEREARDGFGIEFEGAYDTRRLFLHEAYPDDFHPLLKSFKNRPLELKPGEQRGIDYPFKECSGEGMYQVPVGPVHAGVIEPGHFRFGVMGETIFNLEIRHFYKHRGLEKLAENKRPEECTAIAESISGDESAANAAAFAMAIEDINGCAVPRRAREIRTVLLEMERIYSHLGECRWMSLIRPAPARCSY